MHYCLCQWAFCQNAFQPQALMLLPSPLSITPSIHAGNTRCVVHLILTDLLGSSSSDKSLFGDHTVLYVKGSCGHWRWNLPRILVPSSVFFIKPHKKHCPDNFKWTDPVRSVHGPLDPVFLPGPSGWGHLFGTRAFGIYIR